MKMQIFELKIAISLGKNPKICSNYAPFCALESRGITLKDVNKRFENIFQKMSLWIPPVKPHVFSVGVIEFDSSDTGFSSLETIPNFASGDTSSPVKQKANTNNTFCWGAC